MQARAARHSPENPAMISPRLLSRLAPLLLLVTLSACGKSKGAAPAAAGPNPVVVAALDKGVNLSTWFTDRGAPNIDPNIWYIDSGDFKIISDLGLKHVRIPLDPGFLEDSVPATLKPNPLSELRQGIVQANNAGLVVVLALQPGNAIKEKLKDSEAHVAALEAFWKSLAFALRDISPDRLAFEALNEPMVEDPLRSGAVMTRLAAAIRSKAPRHSIVVGGHKFSNAGELAQMRPLEDPNVIYAFHFYDPHNFTHQGATWGWELWAKFAGWPYPSSPEAVAPVLENALPEAKEHLAWYGQQNWTRAKLGTGLDAAGLWAYQNKAVVWCSEFGVTRDATPPTSRKVWLTDARELLQARRIPWTVWDYAGHFGIVTGPRGARTVDADAAEALGLTLPK